MLFHSEAVSLPGAKIICEAFAEICLRSLGDKPHLVCQGKQMLYPHKVAKRLQVEISLHGAGEIARKKRHKTKAIVRRISKGAFSKENAKAIQGNRG